MTDMEEEKIEQMVITMNRILKGIRCLKREKDSLEQGIQNIKSILKMNENGLPKDQVAILMSLINKLQG